MTEVARVVESAQAENPVKPDARFLLLLQAFSALEMDESCGANSIAEPLRLYFFSLNDGDARRHREDLEAFGFEVVACHDIGALGHALRDEVEPLIVLHSPSEAVHLAVAQVRMRNPHAGLVAVADFPDPLSKAGSLLSGADACIDVQPDSLELAVTILALHRRVRRGASGLEALPREQEGQVQAVSSVGGWRLINGGWSLMAPDDTTLALSVSERRLLMELLGSPGRQLNRPDNAQDGAGRAAPLSGKTRRNLDVIVSRLRRKAAAHDIDLPIRSVRGEGYVFAADYA